MELATKTFFEIIEKNGLVSEANLKTLKSGIRKKSLLPKDLDALVAKKVISRWQAKRLMSGKTRFRIGPYRLLDSMGKDQLGEVYLVRHEAGKPVGKLRLLAASIAEDPDQRAEYLQRVKQFQALEVKHLPKVLEVGEVGERPVVFSQFVPGKNLTSICRSQPQDQSFVRTVVSELATIVTQLDAAGLRHGSIGPDKVILDEKKSVWLLLPADIGSPGPQGAHSGEAGKTDVAALAWLAGGMLSGDFEDPSADDSELALQFVELAKSNAESMDELQEVLATAVPAVPQIPAADRTRDESSNDIADLNLEPGVVSNTLDDFEAGTDMFGNFEDVDVASEIPAPVGKPMMPVIKDNETPNLEDQDKDRNAGTSSDPETEPEGTAKSRRTLVLSIAGGTLAVALITVLIVVNMGRGDDPDQQVATGQTANGESNEAGIDQSKDTSNEKLNAEPNSTESEEGAPKDQKLESSGLFSKSGSINQLTQQGVGAGVLGNQKTNAGQQDQKSQKKANQSPVIDQPDVSRKSDPAGQGPDGKGKIPIPGLGGMSKPKIADKNDSGPAEGNQPGPVDGKPEPKKELPEDPKSGATEPKEKQKKEGDEPDVPLLIIGGNGNKESEKKSGPATGDSPKFTNPFVKTPRFVELAFPKRGGQPPKVDLFPLKLPPRLPLRVSLHGGDRASKLKTQFRLRASTSENSTWNVTLAVGSGTPKSIGKFKLVDDQLRFLWESAASQINNVVYLKNCGVRIEAADFKHEFALRSPVVSEPISFERSLNAIGEAKIDDLPNMENVKIELVDVPAEFPDFDYPKDKDFLTGRVGETNLFFSVENIDRLRVDLTSRLRGSKLILEWKTFFVTPDKQSIKLSRLEQFVKATENRLAEIDQLQMAFNKLTVEYNKLQSPEQKREFSRRTGRVALEKRVASQNVIKKHLIGTLKVVQAMKDKKVGFRVYYQAGEMKVDLATPSGQPFVASKPQPGQKPASKKGAAKKANP